MDFIPDIDITMGAEEKVTLLKQARKRIVEVEKVVTVYDLQLYDRDVDMLRLYALDSAPIVRAAAVDILAYYGPVTWEDAEQWMLDVSKNVRNTAFSHMDLSFTALAQLCMTDKPRCANLFAESARRNSEFSMSITRMYGDDEEWDEDWGEEWIDLIWSQLGPLLDIGNIMLNSSIICGILEDILRDQIITLEDPRLQAWIKGDSVERKMALLSVVQWFAMREPWQQDIAKALASDSNEIVSQTAKSFLANKPVKDIQNREWTK